MVNHNEESVFIVIGANWKDGAWATPAYVKSQAESLQNAGWTVHFGFVDDRTSLRGVIRNISRLRHEVLKAKPALVHAQYGSVTAAVANWIRGSLPLVVSFCGDDLLGTPSSGIVWRIRERCARRIGIYAGRRASTIIVKGQVLLQALPPDLQRKAIVLPNGVDTKMFRLMDRDECRARLGWNKKSKIILFDASWNGVSEDQSRKNPGLARATIDLLTKSTPDIQLHMISGVPHTDVPMMMNAADCLLVTSRQEGSANIIKEAMACNLPVVSVPCGDAAERLSMTHPGCVRAYDAGALAEALHRILLAGCRSNGRVQLIRQGLTTVNVAAHLINIYKNVQEPVSLAANPIIYQS